MTETSPINTMTRPPYGTPGEARERYRAGQGRLPDIMQFRTVDDSGRVFDLHDRNQGELQVRGNMVTGSYYSSPEAQDGGTAYFSHGAEIDEAGEQFTEDGWLRTGDVDSTTHNDYLTIHDRARNVIHSGGEWIYSAQLENFVMESPQVLKCVIIGIPDRKWGERPLAITVLMPEVKSSKEATGMLHDELRPKLPRWMLPEYWVSVDSIDKTSVGKFDKKSLRSRLSAGQYSIVKLEGPGKK